MILYVIEVATVNVENAKKGKIKKNKEREIECRKTKKEVEHVYMRLRNCNTVKSVVI